MHGYYLFYKDIEAEAGRSFGIGKKVAAQIRVLNEQGCGCDFLFCPQPETTASMVASCLPGLSDGIQWPDPASLADADYLYIRRPRFASKDLIAFLQGFRQVRPDALVIYEVPTFPYDGEMEAPKLRPALAKDRKWRERLKDYVNYVADLSGAGEIFGIPTIRITNGVDLDQVSVRTPRPEGDVIEMVQIAFFEPWHGTDRLLEGLAAYRDQGGERKLHLHLIGGGSQLGHLRAMAKQLGLEDVVTFHGPLGSEDLKEYYDRCSIAFESLGRHRNGNMGTSYSIKSREYLGVGIPFVYSMPVDLFLDNPVDFCLQIPQDDSPIDIQAVLDFHDRLYQNRTAEEVARQMRAYAEEHASMQSAFKNVVDRILSWEGHADQA